MDRGWPTDRLGTGEAPSPYSAGRVAVKRGRRPATAGQAATVLLRQAPAATPSPRRESASPMPQKILVVVTRKLPDPIETRMMELFDVRLNLEDTAMSQAELAAAVQQADVL